MNPKENNWNKNRGIYFQIGIIIALALALTAFEWKSFEIKSEVSPKKMTNTFDEIEQIEIPVIRRKIPPPPKQKIESQTYKEVPNEKIIQEILKIDIEDEPVIDEPITIEKTIEEEPEEVTDEPFLIVQENAEPKNGYKQFYKFIGKKMKYPRQAKRMGIEGTVYIQFVVERNGSLSDIKIIKGIGAGCDNEALRVLNLSPIWKPGKQRGRAVRQRIMLPIKFSLR